MKSLFSLADFSLKSRVSAFHYRTMVGRINLWALMFTVFSFGVLYVMNFPVVELIRSMFTGDEATLAGIVEGIRNTEMLVLLIMTLVMVYLFILSIGAMIMRLHDFGRSGFWVIPLLILPSIVDTYLVDVLAITQIGWLVLAVAVLMLYKNGDFGKNAYGYEQNAPEGGWSLSMMLVSYVPIVFILADLALVVFSGF